MPRDKAIFPEIVLVIKKVIIGRIHNVAVCEVVLIQPCPVICNKNLKDNPIKKRTIIVKKLDSKLLSIEVKLLRM